MQTPTPPPHQSLQARAPRLQAEPSAPVVLRGREITPAQVAQVLVEEGDPWEMEVEQIAQEMMRRLGLER